MIHHALCNPFHVHRCDRGRCRFCASPFRFQASFTMPFTVLSVDTTTQHHWAVVRSACDLMDPADLLLIKTVEMVRNAYGESRITEQAERLMAAEIETGAFSVGHLITAVRDSLPDPSEEGSKKPWLTNYRSEAAEMVARGALASAYSMEFPVAPQQAKPNANQPILGFDGWGLLQIASAHKALVLIQVKGTDENKCPPGEAQKLATECINVPQEHSKISRALVTIFHLLPDDDTLKKDVLLMLEGMGSGNLPTITVAPVVVRGVTDPHVDDLKPVQDVVASLTPALARGATVSIGTNLTNFGHEVMTRARTTS